MKILITGGTGLIGSAFITKYQHKYKFVVLTRDPNKAKRLLPSSQSINFIDNLSDKTELDEFDTVINLAGEPIVDKRWTLKQKRSICQSRWKLTNKLSQLINESNKPPKVFISGSAVGYYGRQGDTEINEHYKDINEEFSHKICKVWEDKALLASDKTRVCILRTGIVLANSGGALQKMLPAFKFCLGGRISSGHQYMSWIHITDMVDAIEFLLNNENCQGPFNLTAPKPVTNQEFTKALAKSLHRPSFMTVPAIALKLLLGEMSDLLLYGQKVLPEHLLAEQFKFNYPNINIALAELHSK
ncbi:TIGR01777 family oxidoreductase [Thalassotalea psychrophila]|uniref:TIGR01777 family oxidoreductase n=1 Tax=Thalassotalea psychrophila TaxID=3065647 RepID=A0ABY9U0N8_9GAMM|nr:TIGR01777 family oxidoreductase [Colwelliaceae bacterium SQ149]